MEAETEAKPYQTLEQQIANLWMSRGLKVIEEKCEHISEDIFRWTITAEKATPACPKCGGGMDRHWRPKEGPDETNYGWWVCPICDYEERAKPDELKAGEISQPETQIDLALAEDALAKLAATVALLKRLEECEKCDLKDDLAVLLEDSVHQFMMTGLEPNNDPTTQATKRKRL